MPKKKLSIVKSIHTINLFSYTIDHKWDEFNGPKSNGFGFFFRCYSLFSNFLFFLLISQL